MITIIYLLSIYALIALLTVAVAVVCTIAYYKGLISETDLNAACELTGTVAAANLVLYTAIVIANAQAAALLLGFLAAYVAVIIGLPLAVVCGAYVIKYTILGFKAFSEWCSEVKKKAKVAIYGYNLYNPIMLPYLAA